MGYHVYTTGGTFRVPAANVADAFACLIGRGASWGEPYDEDVTDLAILCEREGFDGSEFDADGSLVLGDYADRSRTEDEFLYELAPFATGWVGFHGSDDETWRVLGGGTDPNRWQSGWTVYGLSAEAAEFLRDLPNPGAWVTEARQAMEAGS